MAGHGMISALGLAAYVMYLCDDIQPKNQKVFFDYFFNSIRIIQGLKQLGVVEAGPREQT